MSLEGGDGGTLSSRGKQAAVLQPRKGGVPAERNNEGKAQWTRSCRSEGRMGGTLVTPLRFPHMYVDPAMPALDLRQAKNWTTCVCLSGAHFFSGSCVTHGSCVMEVGVWYRSEVCDDC